MAKVGSYPIPFDADTGDLMHWPNSWTEMVWEANHEFDDTLTFVQFHRSS